MKNWPYTRAAKKLANQGRPDDTNAPSPNHRMHWSRRSGRNCTQRILGGDPVIRIVLWLDTANSHVMHEQSKLDEAKYFLAQMRSLINDRSALNFNLSEFLASARSVLQYAHKESQPKQGGPAWHDNAVAQHDTVRFFKDKRDISIHANPVSPSATINVSVTDTLHLSDSVSATIVRNDGTIEEIPATPPTSSPTPAKSESTVTYEYFFKDWNGSDDVISLSGRYVAQLESIVADGVAKGFLTPKPNGDRQQNHASG